MGRGMSAYLPLPSASPAQTGEAQKAFSAGERIRNLLLFLLHYPWGERSLCQQVPLCLMGEEESREGYISRLHVKRDGERGGIFGELLPVKGSPHCPAGT